MITFRLVAALVVVAAAGEAACTNLSVNDSAATLWDTQLMPAPAYPDVSGQAAAVSRSDGTNLGIGLQGAEPGAQHLWHLRLGTCVVPGQRIGPDSDYPVLDVDGAGSASAEAVLGARLSSGAAYHVEVRLSATDSSRVACGDLLEH